MLALLGLLMMQTKQHGLILTTLPCHLDPFLRRQLSSHPSLLGSRLLTQLWSSMEC